MKFEQIFTPREALLKRRIVGNRASKRWRQRNPQWVEAIKPRNREYFRRWVAEHPSCRVEWGKKKVRLMKPEYLRQLLRQHGRPVTPETIEQKRIELQAFRSRRAFRTLYASTAISQATG